MKKFLLLALSVVAMLSSCQKDDLSQMTNEESNMVTLGVNVTNELAKTRSGETVTPPTIPVGYKMRVILEVWTQDDFTNDDATPIERKEVATEDLTAPISFNFELENGEYAYILWADYIPTSTEAVAGKYEDYHYDTNRTYNNYGLKYINYTNSSTPINTADDSYDAFFATGLFTKTAEAAELDEVLTRAVTKVTIAEKNAVNFAYVDNVKVDFETYMNFYPSSLAIPSAQTSLAEVRYDAAPIGTDITINGDDCKVLFYAYTFADTDGTFREMNLEFTSNDATKQIAPITIPAGIPAKRNTRINAAGNLVHLSNAPSNAVSMDVEINGTWENDEEVNMVPYAVGDTYPKGAVGNDIQGVVFFIENGGFSGKIVSLDEKASIAWGPQQIGTNATSESDGLANMAAVKTIDSDFSDYPAFEWVDDLNSTANNTTYESGDKEKWYLPAVSELKLIYDNKDKLNNLSTPLNDDAFYWSSTDYPVSQSNVAYGIYFVDGSKNYNLKDQTFYKKWGDDTEYPLALRAVMAF